MDYIVAGREEEGLMDYIVAEPFVLARDGAVVHYTEREVGTAVELSDAEAAELIAAGKVLVELPGIPRGVGIEVQPGEWAEIVSEDTGGPYETLPEISNPDGTPLTAAKGYDDGKPDSDWSRAALNAYAAGIGIEDAETLRTRADVLAAIRAKEGDGA